MKEAVLRVFHLWIRFTTQAQVALWTFNYTLPLESFTTLHADISVVWLLLEVPHRDFSQSTKSAAKVHHRT